MRSTAYGVADLLLAAFEGGTTQVEEMHRTIASRPFEATRRLPVSPIVRSTHDAIAGLIYETVRGTGRVLRSALREGSRSVLEEAARGERRSTLRHDLALGALNGFLGDRLERERNPLALPMEIRRGGGAVALERAALRAAWPDPSRRLAIFVHGLCETDHAWGYRAHAEGDVGRRPFPSLFAEELGFSSITIRYNTGLSIAENGRRLAALLDGLSKRWPGGVREIVLVGHSMGGLVARSACHYGRRGGGVWVSQVRHVVCLGSPHLGAPLEQAATRAGGLLSLLGETRFLAAILDVRSAGIKDLREGTLTDDEERNVHEMTAPGTAANLRLVSSIRYHFLATTLTRDPTHPMGRVLGDLLVRTDSAAASADRRPPAENVRIGRMGGLDHFDLLTHPDVHRWMVSGFAPNAFPLASA